ncbi:unnamed protein product [Rhodiola kirilowii]
METTTAMNVIDLKIDEVVEQVYACSGQEDSELTVLKTSLFFAGDGFSAFDSKGELIFRVESYGPDAVDASELVLMDASGRCLLTVRRKRPSLHQRWEGFKGDKAEGQKPFFSVKRSSMIGRCAVTVEMYTERGEEYQIEGCFGNRCCTIFNSGKEAVAEIKRKVDASVDVLMGIDVFSLYLKPGFDAAFAMGLVLVLDQINGDEDFGGVHGDDVDDDGVSVHSTTDH